MSRSTENIDNQVRHNRQGVDAPGTTKGEKFFQGTRPGRNVTHASANFDLPILYFRDDFFALFFSADKKKIEQQLPSENLHPVLLPNQRAMVVVGAFNYIDTSIGPYGEMLVGIPLVYGKKPIPIAPALMESRYPGFGIQVAHLPVTAQTARDAGRGEWGYAKFIAEMDFSITPEYLECRMFEKDEHILSLRVARQGFFKRDKKPISTFSVKDGKLIKTTIPQEGSYRQSIRPQGSHLQLGSHPVANSVREMDLSEKPVISRYYVERSGILPAGEVIEENVAPLEGHLGEDLEGRRSVSYME
ncbi:MAG: acetoacetate decarboxylase family protein [Thermodesulfobacteriota bacterium]